MAAQERTERALTERLRGGPLRSRSDPRRSHRAGRSAPRRGVAPPDAGPGGQRAQPGNQLRSRSGGGGGGGTTDGDGTTDSSAGGGRTTRRLRRCRHDPASPSRPRWRQQGVPYRYAASSPGVAFDCSGLTAYAWGQAGVGLPHQSRAAVRVGAARRRRPRPNPVTCCSITARSATSASISAAASWSTRRTPARPSRSPRSTGARSSASADPADPPRPTGRSAPAAAPRRQRVRSATVQSPINGIDRERVTDWIVDNIDGAVAPFEFGIIAGGRSNLTFTVIDANGRRYVASSAADGCGAGHGPRHGA